VNAHRIADAPTRRSQVVLDGPTASSSGTDSAVPTWNESMEPIAKAGAVAIARALGRPASERLVVGQEMIAGPSAMRPDHAGKRGWQSRIKGDVELEGDRLAPHSRDLGDGRLRVLAATLIGEHDVVAVAGDAEGGTAAKPAAGTGDGGSLGHGPTPMA